MKKRLRLIPDLASDLAVLAGAALFSYGAWLAWHPLGFMVGGLLLSSVAFLYGYRRQGTSR
jgi:hypothetical protein